MATKPKPSARPQASRKAKTVATKLPPLPRQNAINETPERARPAAPKKVAPTTKVCEICSLIFPIKEAHSHFTGKPGLTLITDKDIAQEPDVISLTARESRIVCALLDRLLTVKGLGLAALKRAVEGKILNQKQREWQQRAFVSLAKKMVEANPTIETAFAYYANMSLEGKEGK